MDRVLKDGWKSLSAKETGRVGGLMTKKKREMKMEALKEIKQLFRKESPGLLSKVPLDGSALFQYDYQKQTGIPAS